jgi:hypothetical protein
MSARYAPAREIRVKIGLVHAAITPLVRDL